MGCRGLAVLVWGLLWIAAAAAAEEPEEAEVAQSLQVGNSRLELYGFVRVDAIFDDGRPNSFQSPSFIQPDDPARDDGNFTLHPRLTRLGADVSGPALERLGGAAISGKVEIDFQAGGSESRQLLRLRHGWMQLTWDRSSLLVGQTWDVISPLFPTVNSDTLMWNAGNLGDRRPMIRAQIDRGAFSLAGALGQTGAIDAQDLDGDGASDGGSSGLPHLQARAGWVLPLAGEQELSFGLSGHVAKEETSFPVAGGEDEFDSHSLSLDWKAGLTPRVTLMGELWTGENLADFRGGIAQGVNAATGQEIASQGGWIELGIAAGPVYSFYAGYTLDDPDDDDLPAGGRSENSAWYVVNRFKLGRPLMVGIDYLCWTTELLGRPDGEDNRINLYAVYNF